MKLSILTGAGASYGAGKLVPQAPPLGSGLYKELARRFPSSWGNFSWQYASLLRRDFELGMQQVWEKRLDLVQGLMIDMACYFSEFYPSKDGSDCYSRLASAIAERTIVENIAFATLNYDCVLDIAACYAGLKIAYAGFPPPVDNLAIWKLHGACNLLPDVEIMKMTITAESILDGPVKPVDLPIVRQRYQADGLAVPPVMCVYMPGKPTQTVKKVLTQVRQEWAAWMKETDNVVVIGTSPNLVEDYVWQPIIDSSAEVWYVGGTGRDYAKLSECLGKRFKHVAPTFETAIDMIIKNLLMKY